MKTKHTPGPWNVITERQGGVVCSARIYAGPSSTDKVVAYVGGDDTVEDSRGRIWERLSDEGERNARLIAAAPELLEALEEVAAVLDDGDLDTAVGLGLDTWVMRARAALAKAKGGA